jgi:hypothetical protein
MPRPKGSKNKPKSEPTDFEIEQAESDEEVLAASSEDEDVDDDMAEEDDRPPQGMTRVAEVNTSRVSGPNEFLEAFREQTAALVDMMPAKKVPFSRFKTRSPFNPTGRKRKLKVVLYQNGYRANPKTLTDTEFDIINSSKVRPGQYLSKIVTVRVDRAVSAEDQDKLYISYHNKTPDQRMMNKDHWNGFDDLLRKIVAESEARAVKIKARRQREAVQ